MFDMSVILLISAVVMAILVLVFKELFVWKKMFDQKNLNMIQLYLELKFLQRNLGDEPFVKDSQICGISLIKLMKEYYNFEEILIIDSIKLQLLTNNLTVLKQQIYEFVRINERIVKDELVKGSFIKKYIELNNIEYALYIFPISSCINSSYSSDGFVICIEQTPSLLSKNELIGLEININILKMLMMYDE